MLEVKQLSCGYEKRIIVNGVNFSVKSGEIYGIIGPNGCGKTTLLRALSKILPPVNGKIIYDGKDLIDIKYSGFAKIAAVVSADPYFEGITVEEYVLMGRIPHRDRLQFFDSDNDIKIAEESMVKTDVLCFRDRQMQELSSGERQRVFLAKALAQKPKILFLDEPTSHLDIGHQIELLELLKQLNKETKLTIVIILHDLNLSGSYCDKILLMKDGKVYSEGNVDEVLTYQNIEAVYNTVVIVEKNSITNRPHIFPVPKSCIAK